MARIARIVVPNTPHLIIQRGYRDQQTFFTDEDYSFYLEMMSAWRSEFQVEIWGYCLLPNQVHLIVVPENQAGLSRALGETHRRYTRHLNSRVGRHGPLWKERFASCPVDETWLLIAARYLEQSPVAQGLATQVEEYPWSSARAHLEEKSKHTPAKIKPLLKRVKNWRKFLEIECTPAEKETLLLHERTGRPLGSAAFCAAITKTSQNPEK